MAHITDPKDIQPASLTTQAIGHGSTVVRFTSMNGARSRVAVQLGDAKALITRQEIAALAVLFPVEPIRSGFSEQ